MKAKFGLKKKTKKEKKLVSEELKEELAGLQEKRKKLDEKIKKLEQRIEEALKEEKENQEPADEKDSGKDREKEKEEKKKKEAEKKRKDTAGTSSARAPVVQLQKVEKIEVDPSGWKKIETGTSELESLKAAMQARAKAMAVGQNQPLKDTSNSPVSPRTQEPASAPSPAAGGAPEKEAPAEPVQPAAEISEKTENAAPAPQPAGTPPAKPADSEGAQGHIPASVKPLPALPGSPGTSHRASVYNKAEMKNRPTPPLPVGADRGLGGSSPASNGSPESAESRSVLSSSGNMLIRTRSLRESPSEQ